MSVEGELTNRQAARVLAETLEYGLSSGYGWLLNLLITGRVLVEKGTDRTPFSPLAQTMQEIPIYPEIRPPNNLVLKAVEGIAWRAVRSHLSDLGPWIDDAIDFNRRVINGEVKVRPYNSRGLVDEKVLAA